jgi:endoglucanase
MPARSIPRKAAVAVSTAAVVVTSIAVATLNADAATTTHQAEGATLTRAVVESNHAGFSGSGFVNTDNVVGSAVQWSVPATAGNATLKIRYANGTTAGRAMRVTVNGAVVNQGLTFGGTGSWTTWREQTVAATLRAGTNDILLTATTADGGPNLDQLVIETGVVARTPVAANGQLRVCGVKLCNENGKQIQLRGMSTHGLQWYESCVKPRKAFEVLANDWKADHVRLSMYIQEGGYETNPQYFTNLMDTLINQASELGIYVIVDWHQLSPGDPNANLDRAKTFFQHIARTHGTKKNILYDIANEPNQTSWARIKSYHEQVIPVIRAIDPDALILLGTRGWGSLGVSDGANETEVVNNPVNATNIMYTFHFYAASHGDLYLNTLSRAADRIPVFVTEFGTQEASGDGGNNFGQTQRYIDLMAQKKISWTNWNYSDDFRTGAAFTPGTCAAQDWGNLSRVKEAGRWVRDRIITPADDF